MIPPPNRPLVLIIEDDQPIRRFLRATLANHDYRVKDFGTATEGLMQARTQRPDLILLDLGLPDGDGLDIIKTIRLESMVPIVVLSAREQERDKVVALDSGADDYLTKPFGVNELIARIRVALRHAARPALSSVQVYEVSIDGRTVRFVPDQRSLTLTDASGTKEIRLTPTEFKLLAYLVKYAGKVLTHQQILKEVWGPTHVMDLPYLRVYAGQLRQKLEIDSAQPRFLITEAGVGYRFAAEGADNDETLRS